LREQFLSFALQSAFQKFHFYTFKGLESAEHAKQLVDYLTLEIKREKPRYNAKSEYIFVISNHGFSGWHIHLILNNPLLIPTHAHIEPVRNLKAACLYLVKNLESSRYADYGKARRYTASALLNKQKKKTAYKTRLRLFKIRTRKALADVVTRVITEMVKVIVVHRRVQCVQCSDKPCKPIADTASTPVERPPPRAALKKLVIMS